jgi:hypothetical protein
MKLLEKKGGTKQESCAADDEVHHGGAILAADLVVVSGRRSRLPEWLTALGFEAPAETVVNSFQGYASPAETRTRPCRRPASITCESNRGPLLRGSRVVQSPGIETAQ